MSLTHSVATATDWELIVAIEQTQIGNKLYVCSENIEEAKKYLCHSTIFLLYYNGNLAGEISFEIKGEEAEINGFVILPKYQHKGVGKYGLDVVMATLTKKKGKKIKLVTHPENTRALIMYLSRGFKITGWLDNPFGDGEPRLQLEFF